MHPLAHILDALIFGQPSPLQVITRAWEGSSKEQRAKQNWPHETQLHAQNKSTILYLNNLHFLMGAVHL